MTTDATCSYCGAKVTSAPGSPGVRRMCSECVRALLGRPRNV